MAITVKEVYGFTSYTERNGKPLELSRRFSITGLTASTNLPIQALGTAAVTAGIPSQGKVHPNDGDQRVESRQFEPLSGTSGYVTCIYGWNPASFTIISGGASLQQIQSSRKGPLEDDGPIILTHTRLPEVNGARQQGARITASVSRASVVGVQTITNVNTANKASQHVSKMVGKINAGVFLFTADDNKWQVATGDFDPIAYTGSGNLDVARFTWSFVYREEKFNPIVVDAKHVDGRPFTDILSPTQPGATVKIDWYTEIDFSELSNLS